MERVEARQDWEGLKENLLKIGQEKYAEFQATVYNERIAENFSRLEKNIEIVLSHEDEEKIKRFLKVPEEEPEIKAVLDRQNVDLASLLKKNVSDEERVEIINKFIVKDKSFSKAVEKQKEQGINLEGFEHDSDFANLDDILKKVFSDGLIDKALISKIVYQPDLVYVDVKGSNFYLSVEKYDEWKSLSPEIQLFKFRAGNFSLWNKVLHLTPEYNFFSIDIFSFHDEDLSQFDYLADLPVEEKMRYYKLGTIFHEVGHNLHFNLMGTNDCLKWKALVDQSGSLTYYSKKHAEIYGSVLNYNEMVAKPYLL